MVLSKIIISDYMPSGLTTTHNALHTFCRLNISCSIFVNAWFDIVKDKSKVQLIDVNFDIMSLNLMCYYVLSQNISVRRSHLMNLRNLFEIIDMEIYRSDP